MKRSRIAFIVIAVVAFAAGGAWLARSLAPHKHELEQKTDAQGKVYYTCAMHPQVKQDEPGNCPVCGMKLVKREEGGAKPEGAPSGEREVLYYYDPMKPEVHFDKPGKSPFMDMDLVPKHADEGAGSSVQIDPRVVQNLGIRTLTVSRGSFSKQMDTVGAVEVDERRIVVVESRAAGWVERLDVRAVGDPVRRGQSIAGVYSPDLYAAQEELALAARGGDGALVEASRRRLALLGMSESQIESVVKTGRAQREVSIVAPTGGIVTELNVREGQQVMPGTPLARIADLSRIWITIEVPEAQGAWIRQGRAAEVRLSGLPGKVFNGQINYTYPRLETQTRTVRARIALDNPGLALKPGMYADVALSGGERSDVLLVPTEAVIRTGERNVVILAEGEGRFRPAIVKVGDDRGGQTEILSGLEDGETIVVSGQFLIDSEANLRSVLARMLPEREDDRVVPEKAP